MSGNPKRTYAVRYARIVVMEATVEADSFDEVKDEGLPGAFDGASDGTPGPHVRDVQDYEWLWEVNERGTDRKGRTPIPRPATDGRHARPLTKRMTARQLRAAMGDDGFVSAVLAFDLDELGAGTDCLNDACSRAITGDESALEDMSREAVGVDRDGNVLVRVTGNVREWLESRPVGRRACP